MTDQTYNGWTNWETWNFKLWIDNNQGLYNIVQKAGRDLKLQETLVAFLKGTAKNIINTELCLDLKKKHIKNINFIEIADSIRDEVNNDGKFVIE